MHGSSCTPDRQHNKSAPLTVVTHARLNAGKYSRKQRLEHPVCWLLAWLGDCWLLLLRLLPLLLQCPLPSPLP
jgi:hypothetical protein